MSERGPPSAVPTPYSEPSPRAGVGPDDEDVERAVDVVGPHRGPVRDVDARDVAVELDGDPDTRRHAERGDDAGDLQGPPAHARPRLSRCVRRALRVPSCADAASAGIAWVA
uniref:Uncharacterized protein n=1 Tax=Janibacter limosus TaxID=53458 RepID=A0AC61U302_9MICO|nr:hypothetical protein [Janibacter limosus]